jgi:LemA protein
MTTLVVVVLVLVALVVVVAVGALVRIRNRLVALAASCDEAWSDVDAQLRRRHDLVPALVETVRGYAAHETTTLDAVTTARAAAVSVSQSAAGVPAIGAAEAALTAALRPLVGVAERYPALQADQPFQLLQKQLAGTEAEIAAARDIYNSNVATHNTALLTFPGNAVGPLFGLRPRPLLQAE